MKKIRHRHRLLPLCSFHPFPTIWFNTFPSLNNLIHPLIININCLYLHRTFRGCCTGTLQTPPLASRTSTCCLPSFYFAGSVRLGSSLIRLPAQSLSYSFVRHARHTNRNRNRFQVRFSLSFSDKK